MTMDEQYMFRCLQLAQLAGDAVAPNPMVGAVLVHEGSIIGEGWHQRYGYAHAEVNCIEAAIVNGHADKLQLSTLYVSLEPCAHFGKTPPCSDLIIRHKIPKVVIGCRDPFSEVNGKGIEKLEAAGIEVVCNVCKEECELLNKRFFTFHLQHRPYIVLKWAQTADRKIGSGTNQRLLISNAYTNRLVHQWRSEEAAVLIGKRTAMLDDPQLTNRYFNRKQPLRIVLDKELALPATAQLMNHDAKTVIFNYHLHREEGQPQYYQIGNDANIVHQIINGLYKMKVLSVLVEGGARLLQSFIDDGMWDEARVIQNEILVAGTGLNAPVLQNHELVKEEMIVNDRICFYSKMKI